MKAEKPTCSATSKQTGARCGNPPIAGGTVCRFHGGAAPQVQAKAEERLAALIDPAIERLAELVRHRRGEVAYRAVKDVLDRNGFKAPDKTELSTKDGKPWGIRLVIVPSPAKSNDDGRNTKSG